MVSHPTTWLIGAAVGALLLALATRQFLLHGRKDAADRQVGDLQIMKADLADWTDAELYEVWCATATELLRALHAEHAATAAEARRYLLTEIERRHPTRTAAWLNSDAVLSGDPPHFLISRDTE